VGGSARGGAQAPELEQAGELLRGIREALTQVR
jgi:hypothetical protein